MSRPKIVKVRVTLSRTKQRRGSELPANLTFEDITIQLPDRRSKLEVLFDKKSHHFVDNGTAAKYSLPSQLDMISYYRMAGVEVLQDLGETAYHVDDSYNEVELPTSSVQDELVELDEEEWDNG